MYTYRQSLSDVEAGGLQGELERRLQWVVRVCDRLQLRKASVGSYDSWQRSFLAF